MWYLIVSIPDLCTLTYIDKKLIPEILTRYEYPKTRLQSSVKEAAVIEYTDWDNLDDDNKQFDRFIDLLSDYNFIVPVAPTAKKHTNSFQRAYVYKMSSSPPKHFFPVYSELDGPSVAKAMITLWTNFAKTG